jgi:hypothetical protein
MIDSHNLTRSTRSLDETEKPDGPEDHKRPFDGRRPAALPLSALEIRGDLTKLFHYLNINLAQYEEGSSSFLKTHGEALLYAERVATYAIHDYPRHADGEPQVTTLWDALHRIRRTISAWRTGEHSGDGQTELSIIKKIIQNTLCEVNPPEALA